LQPVRVRDLEQPLDDLPAPADGESVDLERLVQGYGVDELSLEEVLEAGGWGGGAGGDVVVVAEGGGDLLLR